MSTIKTTTTLPAAATARDGALGRFGRDTINVMMRELKPTLREPFGMIIALVQPLVFLALFAPLLPDSDGSALQWFVPGIIAMATLIGASMTGSALSEEMMSGSHERLLVSPLSRPALIVGRALKEIVPVLIQTAIVVAIVTPFSFDLHLGGVLVGVAILALFAVGIGAMSYALALAAEGQEWLFWTVQQTLLFPLLLLAGVLLPLNGAPGWLSAISEANPLTYIVEAERALFAGQWPAGDVLQAALAAIVVAALGLTLGLKAMRAA